MNYQQIISDIDSYIQENGGSYGLWYIGIATKPKTRLFNDHNVLENGGAWIHIPADTEQTARNAEQYFLDKGCDGGSGGGDSSTSHVYAYLKTSYTKE